MLSADVRLETSMGPERVSSDVLASRPRCNRSSVGSELARRPEEFVQASCHRRRCSATRLKGALWILTVGLVFTSYRRYPAKRGGCVPIRIASATRCCVREPRSGREGSR